jgi:hypothetical protein
MAVDAANNDVFVGGDLSVASGVAVSNLAHWDGTRWQPLGNGTNGPVHAMLLHGDDVIVGGNFSIAGAVAANGLARWNRKTQQWSALSTGRGPTRYGSPAAVLAIAVHGDWLYVGGDQFDQVDGVPAIGIARLHLPSQTWQALGGIGGLGEGDFGGLALQRAGVVRALAVDAAGNVFAGGSFNYANNGGSSANILVSHVAQWQAHSNTWQALGSGVALNSVDDAVNAIHVVGADVFVGGHFAVAGGIKVNSLSQWDTTTQRWHILDIGIADVYGDPGHVHTLLQHNRLLYVAGQFASAGRVPATNVAVLDLVSRQWQTAPTATSTATATATSPVQETASQPANTMNGGARILALGHSKSGLWAAGHFSQIDNLLTANIAHLDEGQWRALGKGVQIANTREQLPLHGEVFAMAVNDQSQAIVGGHFSHIAGQPMNNIALWDGDSWVALGDGVNGTVRAVAIRGDDVYVGGMFTHAGNRAANRIARWNMQTQRWSNIGSGVNGDVFALAFGPDGLLYAGGAFSSAGSVSANNLARWNSGNNAWESVSPGLGFANGAVYALAADHNGLFVGGDFQQLVVAGRATPAQGLMFWEVASNSVIIFSPNPTQASNSNSVKSLVLSGDASELYVGGRFDSLGGVAAQNVARLSARGWEPLGTGVNGAVASIQLVGNDIFVGGRFTHAGATPAINIARWHIADQTWSALGQGLPTPDNANSVNALAAAFNGLYVGGDFVSVGGEPAAAFAIWGEPRATLDPKPSRG